MVRADSNNLFYQNIAKALFQKIENAFFCFLSENIVLVTLLLILWMFLNISILMEVSFNGDISFTSRLLHFLLIKS